MAEIFQAELAKVGLKGVIEKLPQAEGVQRLRSGTYNGAWLGSVGYMHMTPSTMFVMAQPYRLPNGSNFDTPEYRKLIDDVTSATDEAALKKTYAQMNEYLLDQCFLLPIASVDRPMGASNKVNGLRYTRGSLILLVDTFKSK